MPGGKLSREFTNNGKVVTLRGGARQFVQLENFSPSPALVSSPLSASRGARFETVFEDVRERARKKGKKEQSEFRARGIFHRAVSNTGKTVWKLASNIYIRTSNEYLELETGRRGRDEKAPLANIRAQSPPNSFPFPLSLRKILRLFRNYFSNDWRETKEIGRDWEETEPSPTI